MSWRDEHYSSLNDIFERRTRHAGQRATARARATLPYGELNAANRGLTPAFHYDPTPVPPIAPIRPTRNVGGMGGQAARIANKQQNWAVATNRGLGGGFGSGNPWQKTINTPGTAGFLPTSTYARAPKARMSVTSAGYIIPPPASAPAAAAEAAATGTSVRETIQNKFSEGKIGTRLNAGLTGIGFFGGGDLPRASAGASEGWKRLLEFGEGNGARIGLAAGFGALGVHQMGSMVDRARNHQYGSAALHGAVGASAAAMAYGYAMNKEALSNHLAIAAKMFMKKI